MKTPTVEIVFRFTPLYFLLSGNCCSHEHKHKLLEICSKFREHFFSNSFSLNPINANVATIQKPVNRFAQQIN